MNLYTQTAQYLFKFSLKNDLDFISDAEGIRIPEWLTLNWVPHTDTVKIRCNHDTGYWGEETCSNFYAAKLCIQQFYRNILSILAQQ